MSFIAALFAPLALLVPAAGPVEGVPGLLQYTVLTQAEQPDLAIPMDQMFPAFGPADQSILQMISLSFLPQTQDQVRIEQRITIRITPAQPAAQPNMLAALPTRPLRQRMTERDFGRCLPVAGIAGVQASADNRLILYLRDSRIVSAALDRTCNARDFYSGFYMQRTSDGQLCVNRDTLQSRSGANCKLSRFRQLVESGN